jgi:exopolyphosphatase/guanosine-5'-triphosphate,3'-diphosphate pyrophosphatase
VPGIKFARGDLILAGAVVIDTVLEVGGFGMLEATDAGLREGVFFESLLGDPPLVDDVRRATVRNLAAQYDINFTHAEHVARLSLELWDGLAAAGVHRGDPTERELLWATAMLHDIGMAIDYDDHHKHSRYLILSAGLPGYSPRETALIGQAARYHRKGNPGLGEFTALAHDGDEALLNRLAASVRIAEQLERSRDQAVSACDVRVSDGQVQLRLRAKEDVTVARWATERQGDVFRKAFGRNLNVT